MITQQPYLGISVPGTKYCVTVFLDAFTAPFTCWLLGAGWGLSCPLLLQPRMSLEAYKWGSAGQGPSCPLLPVPPMSRGAEVLCVDRIF